MFAAALPHSRPKLSGAVVATRRTTNPLFLASPSSLNLVSFSRVLRKSDGLVSSRSCSSKRGAHDLFEVMTASILLLSNFRNHGLFLGNLFYLLSSWWIFVECIVCNNISPI